MSEAVLGPFITRLNNDLLLLIFKMNADMFSYDKALETTRLSSQICHEWREAILEAPSVWGHLIDLDVLTQRKDGWRNEVLQRSRQSPLSIKSRHALLFPFLIPSTNGTVSIVREIPPWQDFFFKLLDEEWNRIARLTVSIGSHISIPPDILCSPAPQLRVFEICLSSTVQTPPDQNLFDDNAPLLHTFRSRELVFNPAASWLRNLRFIEIGPRFPLSFVLDMLKNAPSLKILIYAGRYGDEADDSNMLGLSSFKLGQDIQRLEIGAGFNSCLNFIGHIIPENDYDFYISTSQADFSPSLDNLSLYAARHFDVHVPTRISLNLSDQFYFSSRDGDGPQFSLRIPCRSTSGNDGSLKMLQALHIPVCNLVIEMDLYVHHLLHHQATLSMISFLRLFPYAKILHVEDFMCSFFIEAQNKSSDILLPSLDTLQVDVGWDNVVDFLHMRQKVGHPISVLDLTKLGSPGKLMIPPENLWRFTGLRVLWP